MLKKLLIVLFVIMCIVSSYTFVSSQENDPFLIMHVEIAAYDGRNVIIWQQNQGQNLQTIYPNTYPRCPNLRVIQYMQYCVIPAPRFFGQINATWFEQGMYFEDESGKLWGPYYTNVAYIPLVDR